VKTEVVVVIGAGGIGMAIARRQGFGKHILLADFNEKLLEASAKELEVASYKVSSRKVDVSSRESVRALADEAASLGIVLQVIQYRWRFAEHGSPGSNPRCGSVRQCRSLRGVRARDRPSWCWFDRLQHGRAYVICTPRGAGA